MKKLTKCFFCGLRRMCRPVRYPNLTFEVWACFKCEDTK